MAGVGEDEQYGSGLVDCYPTEVARIRKVGRQGGLGSFHIGMLGVGNSTDYAPQRIGLYASKPFRELSLDWRPKRARFTVASGAGLRRAVRLVCERANKISVGDAFGTVNEKYRQLVDRIVRVLSQSRRPTMEVRLNAFNLDAFQSLYTRGTGTSRSARQGLGLPPVKSSPGFRMAHAEAFGRGLSAAELADPNASAEITFLVREVKRLI